MILAKAVVLPPPANFNNAMHCNSIQEYAQMKVQDHPRKQQINDASYPMNAGQDLAWCQHIIVAMRNMNGVVDGKKLVTQWQAILLEDWRSVEMAAWRLLVSDSREIQRVANMVLVYGEGIPPA